METVIRQEFVSQRYFKDMNGELPKRLVSFELLLSFLFCGAVVGETLSLSLVVTRIGPGILGKLYLVNALMLLLLPVGIYRFIDRLNRGKFLSYLFLVTVVLVTGILFGHQLVRYRTDLSNRIIVLLYPVAYLSKTVLFLTFWTLLNDIYSIKDAKRRFPVIAAWGFAGALAGVVIARVLITVVSTQTVVVFWMIVYLAGWLYAKKIGKKYGNRLSPVEDIPDIRKSFLGTGELLKNRLIRIMAVFYFGIFTMVFIIDFLFWRCCYLALKTSESVASFQFTFYMVHATVTILLLRFLLPSVIRKVGFTLILFVLPLLFVVGGIILIIIQERTRPVMLLPAYTVFQFFRYVFFELTFAPSYQMFFAAIVKEHRGRSKTFLEGVVKPLAIFSSGIVLVFGSSSVLVLITVIIVCGCCLGIVINHLRRVYSATILSVPGRSFEIGDIIEEVGLVEDEELYELIVSYADSREKDMRMVAVHLLERLGTPQAFRIIRKIYKDEKSVRLKEVIARSVGVFYGYETKSFIDTLLRENNQRIKANAVYAVNNMNCNWKRHLKEAIGPLLFENNQRVQLESAKYMWNYGTSYEKGTVTQLLKNLMCSHTTSRKNAALYLMAEIRLPGWEETLLEKMSSSSFQVFMRASEVLFRNGSDPIRIRALEKIDKMSRRHITFTGELVVTQGLNLWDILVEFISRVTSRRLMFELVAALRKIADIKRPSGKICLLTKKAEAALLTWTEKELFLVYSDAYQFNYLREGLEWVLSWGLLETSVREKQIRLSGWVLSVMVLLDTRDIMKWRNIEINLNEPEQRSEIIEVLESVSLSKTGTLVLPLLKEESWENCAKIGEAYFNLKKSQAITGIVHFLKSENRLTLLSTLYVLDKNPEFYHRKKVVEELLNMLTKNDNEMVADAATDLLRRSGSRMKRSRAFELMDGVLLLKKVLLFHGISADKLLRLVEIAYLVEFQKGDMVSTEGRISDQIYIVKSGILRIEKRVNGTKRKVALINQGESYGEAGLFSRGIRSTAAVAHTGAKVYIIKGSDIKRLVREIPDIGFNLLEVISSRLLKCGEEVEKLKDGIARMK